VINIMGAVSQWEREAIAERTRDVLPHKRSQNERVGNIEFGCRLAADGKCLRIWAALVPRATPAVGLFEHPNQQVPRVPQAADTNRRRR
jgi:hypothetical protein